jgi:hypothetical protein
MGLIPSSEVNSSLVAGVVTIPNDNEFAQAPFSLPLCTSELPHEIIWWFSEL